jgi:hypothetical protein
MELHQMEFMDGIHDIVQMWNSFVRLQEGRGERENSPREYRYRKWAKKQQHQVETQEKTLHRFK